MKVLLAELDGQYEKLALTFDHDGYVAKLADLDVLTKENGFWQDQKKAQAIIAEMNDYRALMTMHDEIRDSLETLRMTYELSLIDETIDLSNVETEAASFRAKIADLQVKLFLNKPYDKFNAIIEFHPGAGGTESQDWAEMLYRMYLRWAETRRFKVNVLEYQDGEEAGLKSATILVSGKNAYGYLKAESGVHRLVRISPFDAAGRRQTSFASVSVVPELDDSINIDIADEDLRIDVYRSGGNGGQSVNTTDSAVRITHLPTKIVVTCQNERSQIQNRETAMKVLRGKLYQLELEKKQEELSGLMTNKVSNAFGSQIRSYVFCPYTMVKDHRTGQETDNVQKVMDGDLDPFITAYLMQNSAS
ncbi:MAG: peptide chain release factor 2 [bacterium]